MKTVALVGMAGPLEDAPQGIDIWGVNLTYRHQPNLTRLYFMDMVEIGGKFHEEIAALDIDVVCSARLDLIPRSRPWPLEQRLREFGITYWTSTLAYMLTDAIAEGYECIILHRLQSMKESPEYITQHACLDFWCGLAIGRGIKVIKSEGCGIAEPFPWQSALYGYMRQETFKICDHVLSAAARAVMRIPIKFFNQPKIDVSYDEQPSRDKLRA